MMTDKPWKLVLLLTGIFLAGLVAGSFGTARLRELGPKRQPPDQWGTSRIKMLAERLDLTPSQVDQLRPIIKRDTEELNRLRESSMKETQRVFQRMEDDIAAMLTPEQKVKFDALNKEMRERWQKFLKDRRPGGPGRGPGRPPGEGQGDAPPPPPEKPSGDI